MPCCVLSLTLKPSLTADLWMKLIRKNIQLNDILLHDSQFTIAVDTNVTFI